MRHQTITYKNHNNYDNDANRFSFQDGEEVQSIRIGSKPIPKESFVKPAIPKPERV